jgi:DNA ligase-1
VSIRIFAFDILYYNGEVSLYETNMYHNSPSCIQPLIEKPLKERRELLEKHFREVEDDFGIACSMVSRDLDEIQTFLDQSVQGEHIENPLAYSLILPRPL